MSGGVAALKAQYSSCAVGKLGLVQAPEWSPRLVVDSSVSAVTENTRHIVGLNFGPRTRDFCVSIIGVASINASHLISGPELRAITGLVLQDCSAGNCARSSLLVMDFSSMWMLFFACFASVHVPCWLLWWLFFCLR